MTTLEAFKQIYRCIGVILSNSWKALNKMVHRYPWVFILTVAFVSSLVSIVNIGKARQERDASCKAMYKMQQKIDTLECMVDKK